MPLDQLQPYDPFFRKSCLGKELKFSFLPRHCAISNKPIFLEYAYRLTAMYTGPGEPLFEYRWINKDEYLIAKIKGIL